MKNNKNINTGLIDSGGAPINIGDTDNSTHIHIYDSTEKSNQDNLFKNKSELTKDYFLLLSNNFSFDSNSYIERTIKFIEKENSQNIDILNLDRINKNTLIDAINSHSKIILLGNPGIGKSTELKSIFQKYFNDELNPFIPFLKSLKTFTLTDTIENFIGYEKNIIIWDSVLFIFDGIDEINNKADFASKLDTFISKLDNQKGFNYKILLSCRNNFWGEINNQINNFKTAALEPLNIHQSVELFEKIIERKITDSEREKVELKSEILQNPFQVKLIAEKFQKDGEINIELASFWEYYIDKRLQNDKQEKFNKGGVIIDIIQFKKDAIKLSLVNELEQKSYFSKGSLNKLFNPNSDVFADNFCQNGLIDQIYLKELFFFEHKSIQEYFSALNFVNLSALQIIDFLKISLSLGDKIHPSLYNVTSYILSLLPDNTKENDKEKIIEWLEKTQPELLIKTFDSIQSINTKIQVFKNYFEKQCIERGYWFDTNNSISIEEFARFGDCKENAEYLYTIIKNPEIHFRTLISAIQILGEFTIDKVFFEKIKLHFLQLLNQSENQEELNTSIIYFFRSQIQKKSTLKESIFTDIFEIFKTSSNKAINRSLLGLIANEVDIDIHFDFIKREFEYEFGIEKRKVKDEVFRGNDWILKELILKLEKENHFIDLAVYFCDDYNYRYDDYIPKILDRIHYFYNTNPEFIDLFLEKFKALEVKNRRFSEEILFKILINLNCLDRGFELLYNTQDFSERKFFLAKIVSETTLNRIIEDYSKFSSSDIGDFRNILFNSNPNRELARIFERETIKEGHHYNEKLESDEEIQLRIEAREGQSQNRFDLLLEKEKLIQKIETFFQSQNLESINREQIFEKQNEFYRKDGRNTPLPLEYEVIQFLTINVVQNVTIKNFKTSIDKPEYYLELVKREIKKDTKIEINNGQFTIIEAICEQLEKSLTFSNLVTVENDKRFSLSPEYPKIELLLHFNLNHKIPISDGTKINCIQVFELDKHNPLEVNFTQFVDSISSREIAVQKAVENIKNHKVILTDFMMQKHINFAIENKLKDTFSVINEYYKFKNDIYPGDKLFYKYYSVSKDEEILKAHLEDFNTYSFWTVLELIIADSKLKGQFENTLITKCKECLKTAEQEFKHKAIKTLFIYKDKEAIEFYIDLLDRKLTRDISLSSFSDYDVLKDNDFSIVSRLYEVLKSVKSDSFEYSYANTFVTTYISNICNDENDFEQVMQILTSVKEELKENLKENDIELFYLNLLIDAITNNFINKLSKPLSFDEALKKVNEIMN